jgi:hypothetical protein
MGACNLTRGRVESGHSLSVQANHKIAREARNPLKQNAFMDFFDFGSEPEL